MNPVPPSQRPRATRELLSEGVRRRLLVSILDGTLAAGERLHDDELVAWLGVSRTPIRSALERLTETGLVEMEPNRFTRVAVPTVVSVSDALEVYSALQAAAARETVPELTAADLHALDARLSRLETVALTRSGQAGLVWAMSDLPVAGDVLGFFAQRSANPLLRSALAEVEMRLMFFLRSVRLEVDLDDIDHLASALRAGADRRDPDAVVRALSIFLTGRSGAA